MKYWYRAEIFLKIEKSDKKQQVVLAINLAIKHKLWENFIY